MARLRVAFEETVLELDAAGTARSVRDLRDALHALDEVDLVPIRQPRSRLVRGRVPRGLVRELAWMPAGAQRRARHVGAQLLHCTAALGPAGRARIPRVVTVHDVLALDHPEWFARANALQQRLVVPGLVRHSGAIIAPSAHTAAGLRRHVDVDPARIHVVPHGVHARFSPGPADPALAARLGITAPYVLTVATLQPRKNLELVLRAHEELRRRGSGVGLVVAGGRGWRDEALAERLADARDAGVVLTGRVGDDDLVSLLRGAACLVHPSVHEGFGFPPVEAMACGTPVVAADGGAVPEVADGAAILVADDDPRAVAEAVTALVDDAELAADHRARGLARTGELTWERCARGVLGAYRAAIGEPPA